MESALSKVLEDVLALPDIPELDSRRLSELCRILNALEALFTTDPDEVRVRFFRLPASIQVFTTALGCGRLRAILVQVLISL